MSSTIYIWSAPTNEHRSKGGNIRMNELLEKRVSEARATSTNSARRIGGLHRNPQWVAGRDQTASHLKRQLRSSIPLDRFLGQGQ